MDQRQRSAPTRTSKPLRYPDFIGIGVQKCGTSWLDDNLRDHQELWLPAIKELHFFNNLHLPASHREAGEWRRGFARSSFAWHFENTPQEKWDFARFGQLAHIASEPVDDAWYGTIFAAASPYQVCGEITPDYSLLSENAIRHIIALSPEIKILINLRDPIDRDWSEIRMLADERACGSVDELHGIAAEPEVARRSDYIALLDRWQRHIPAERLKILFLDDIEEQPLATMLQVCRFLGVGGCESVVFYPDRPVNRGQDRAMPESLHAVLKDRHRGQYQDLREAFPALATKWIARHYGP